MFDKSKDFAKVLGNMPDGCKYIQDNIKYDKDCKPLPAKDQSEEGKASLKAKKEAAEAILKAAAEAESGDK